MKERGLNKREIVTSYYRQVNAGQFPTHLFTENFRFWFPKYGVGYGLSDFMEMIGGIDVSERPSVCHAEKFVFIEQGDRIAVEGTSEGGANGIEWHSEKTSGGRFCAVFTFNDAGLIDDLRIYTDPDVTGADRQRFSWPERTAYEW